MTRVLHRRSHALASRLLREVTSSVDRGTGGSALGLASNESIGVGPIRAGGLRREMFGRVGAFFDFLARICGRASCALDRLSCLSRGFFVWWLVAVPLIVWSSSYFFWILVQRLHASAQRGKWHVVEKNLNIEHNVGNRYDISFRADRAPIR